MLTANIESEVLEALTKQGMSAIDLEDLVAQVVQDNPSLRSVEAKIAALNLVSKGRASLTDEWQIVSMR